MPGPLDKLNQIAGAYQQQMQPKPQLPKSPQDNLPINMQSAAGMQRGAAPESMQENLDPIVQAYYKLMGKK